MRVTGRQRLTLEKFPSQDNASVQIISEDPGGNTAEIDYTIRVDNEVDSLTLQLDNPIDNTWC